MVHIYILIDPITNEIKYCGKTIQTLGSRLVGNYGPYTKNWINSVKKKGLNPQIVEIDYVEEEDWEGAEILYISHLRSLGYPLTNIAEGGGGGKGYIPSEKTKEKISTNTREAMRNPEVREKISNSHKNKPLTPQHKEKISKSLLNAGHKPSPQCIVAAGANRKGKPKSPDFRQTVSNTMKEKGISPPSRKGSPSPLKGKPWSEKRRASYENGNRHRGAQTQGA